jgi:hypothetical protein
VNAGTITLPGNKYGTPVGAGSNYLVLLAFQQAPAQPEYLVWTIPSNEPAAGTVTGVKPQTYVATNLHVGDKYYIDRSFTITALPPALEGLLAIKTANNDKSQVAASFLTFTLSHNATLYVAYDARATRYPDWLTASYTNTGQKILTTDVPLAVWRREVNAGTITLPGNKYGTPVGAGSNYLVLLAFQQEEPSADGWVWDQAANDAAPVFFLEQGTYTLTIKQRESGTRLDQLLITNDLEYQP